MASEDCDCDGIKCVSGQVCSMSLSGAMCQSPCPNPGLSNITHVLNVNTSNLEYYMPGEHLIACEDGYYVDNTQVLIYWLDK